MHSSACNAPLQKNSRSRLFQSLYWRTLIASPPGEDIIAIWFTSRSVCIYSYSSRHRYCFRSWCSMLKRYTTTFFLRIAPTECSSAFFLVSSPSTNGHTWNGEGEWSTHIKYLFFESTNPCDGECDVSVGEMGYFWNEVEFTCHAMECDPGAWK